MANFIDILNSSLNKKEYGDYYEFAFAPTIKGKGVKPSFRTIELYKNPNSSREPKH